LDGIDREMAEQLLSPRPQEPDPLEERIAAAGRLPYGLKELPAGEPRQDAAPDPGPPITATAMSEP
jgi:hypothetical protein